MSTIKSFFDSNFNEMEQLPRNFSVVFKEVGNNNRKEVQVLFNGITQIGDTINDNAYLDDYYRYHDIFHYSFATLLGWSPCTRTMMKCKRKSIPIIDEIEDGARATITEEAISLLLFNEAKRKNYFQSGEKLSTVTLKIIKEMTQTFEVKIRTVKEWEKAIMKAYEIFKMLIDNKGGTVKFDAENKIINFSS